MMRDIIKSIISRITPLQKLSMVFYSVKENGTYFTAGKVLRYLLDRSKARKLMKKFTCSNTAVAVKDITRLTTKISILVPLYNTPNKFLTEMIDSVLAQTYSNWELCIADGSDDSHTEPAKTCSMYCKSDIRIKYIKLNKNYGISENTNRCMELASGDYYALLDHDDVLAPTALFEIATAIYEKKADFIYTDEISFKGRITNPLVAYLKPNFSIDTLRSYNYICHFVAFDKNLFGLCDGFLRSQFDGSQDYDLFLRLTEKASKIIHIPKFLYFWRSHSGSVSGGGRDIKPYYISASINALSEHLKWKNLSASVKENPLLCGTFKIDYDIIDHPSLSIILICSESHTYNSCLDSLICQKYKPLEIIVINPTHYDMVYWDSKNNNSIKYLELDNSFVFSEICNHVVQLAAGEILLFLSDNVEFTKTNSVDELIMYAQLQHVGAVGGKISYLDGKIFNAGMTIDNKDNVTNIAHNNCKILTPHDRQLYYTQNVCAVSHLCLMVRKEIFIEIGGFSHSIDAQIAVIDFCFRLKSRLYEVVMNPFVQLKYWWTR